MSPNWQRLPLIVSSEQKTELECASSPRFTAQVSPQLYLKQPGKVFAQSSLLYTTKNVLKLSTNDCVADYEIGR